MATVEFEIFFALWLLADVWAKPTWAAALACFGLFTCVSLCKALSGHATCGCFGRVAINPWYTCGLDLVVIASLLRWRPKKSLFAVRHAVAVVMIWLLVGIPAAFAMSSHVETTLSDAGEIIGNGKIVVLEPERWTGKRFPLIGFIDIADRLNEGEWLVLLYRSDCPKCQKIIEGLPAIIHESAQQIALIEMPPYGSSITESVGTGKTQVVCGRLSRVREWFSREPIFLSLRDGQVVE